MAGNLHLESGCSYDLNVSLELGEEVGSLLYCRTKFKEIEKASWQWAKSSWQENLSVIDSQWWSSIVIKLAAIKDLKRG